MSPKPALKAETLIEKISELVKQPTGPNEFTLTALKREARALLSTDAFHGYMALGALGALSWDDDELDKNHQNAIGLADNELTHRNYAISLQLVGRREDAAHQAILASQSEPENISNLVRAIEYATLAGNLSAAMSLIHTLKSRTTERVEVYDTEAVLRTLTMTHVPEGEFAQGMRIMHETLRKHRLHVEETQTDIDDDPADPSVLVKFLVNVDFTRAQEIDNEACARLCEELPDGGHSGALMFGIVGMHSNEHHPT